ncbi:MAG: tetratricopeptide repeat protein [Legionellaceae bacterium]|nr:tetratricopeptide repeat protein [Legionellaceae bacterium]
MSIYMTEDEQVEQIKSWWKKYNGILIVALSIMLLTISGFRYWDWRKDNTSQLASIAYEQMMLSFANKDYKSVQSYSSQLIDTYKDTIYADAARLTMAKVAVTRDKYESAKNSLNAVINSSKSTVIIDVARMRLARILIEEKAYESALLQLSNVKDSYYIPFVNELKGDVYAATGKNEEAVEFYNKAMAEADKNGVGNLFLEMKSSELSVKKT